MRTGRFIRSILRHLLTVPHRHFKTSIFTSNVSTQFLINYYHFEKLIDPDDPRDQAVHQARWQDARQERRTVEKLKERRFESWREEISRDDQKTIDGLTQNRRPNEGSPQ